MADNFNTKRTEQLQEDTMKEEKTEPPQRDTTKSFGSFKVMLADILTFATIIRLATLFEYSPRIIEELEKNENRNYLMIRYMEDRGQIQRIDITALLNGLKELDLLGTESAVRKLFEDHTGIRCTDSSIPTQQREGKTGGFVDSLRQTFALWYNKIQPIPYIRERVYCVNDVYVEGGIQVVQSPNSSTTQPQQRSQDIYGDEPKSFSDIFDNNKIPGNRILLEADPGYGKSTFTLQAAYEWCSGTVSSPLKLFQMFILLPLRLLGNISSIYTAIRLLLMPADVDFTDDDIKVILNNCTSGIIVLDGYDEYPDKDNDSESDVIKIIKGKMFSKFKVVLTSRSSSLPPDLDPSTVMIKFTGFDDTAMYEYIKRAVTGGNEEEAKNIKDILKRNPVLADICQIPMFCVLFAHITKEQTHRVARLNSVTCFFKYIISCFYSHMRNKDSRSRKEETIPDYKSLNWLVFDSLVNKSQHITWSKNIFIKTVGSKCYEELLSIGILIEETILTINDKPGVDVNDFVKNQEFVRFYHKLFAEWYAGNYLSTYAGGFWPIWLNYTLEKIDPIDLQYVFRFASGLNKTACGRLVRYLESLHGGKPFASLCLFEHTIDQELLKETVRNLSSDETIIRLTDSKLLQRSNIQRLKVALRNGIPISCVTLNQSFEQVDKDEIKLRSGLTLPKLLTVEKIHIKTWKERELSEDEVVKICAYGLASKRLKEISFEDCFLPLSLSKTVQAAEIIKRNIKVTWCRYGYYFNFQSGLWEVDDVNTVRSLCSDRVDIRNSHSELLQRCTILLMENASNNDIPISCVYLGECSPRVSESGPTPQSGLILRSGLSLPILSSLQQLVISDIFKSLTAEKIVAILGYSSQCTSLKELKFRDYQRPESIPVGLIPPLLKSRKVKVWNVFPLRGYHRLDLTTGLWQRCDRRGKLPGEEGFNKYE